MCLRMFCIFLATRTVLGLPLLALSRMSVSPPLNRLCQTRTCILERQSLLYTACRDLQHSIGVLPAAHRNFMLALCSTFFCIPCCGITRIDKSARNNGTPIVAPQQCLNLTDFKHLSRAGDALADLFDPLQTQTKWSSLHSRKTIHL